MNKTTYVLIVCSVLFSNYITAKINNTSLTLIIKKNLYSSISHIDNDSITNVNLSKIIINTRSNVNPIINCPGNLNVSSFSPFYLLPDFFASGEASYTQGTAAITQMTQSPSPNTVLDDGIHTITLSITDADGNNVSCEFQLALNENSSNTTLSINNDELDFLTIYPNPVKDLLYIKNTGNTKLISLVIFNLNGQKIKDLDLKNDSINSKIDLPNLAAGNYLLSIETKKGRTSKMLLKQ